MRFPLFISTMLSLSSGKKALLTLSGDKAPELESGLLEGCLRKPLFKVMLAAHVSVEKNGCFRGGGTLRVGGALPQQVEQLARSSSLVFKLENYFAGKGMVGTGKVSQVQINCVGLMTNQCGRGPGEAGVARRRRDGGLETVCKSTYVLS